LKRRELPVLAGNFQFGFELLQVEFALLLPIVSSLLMVLAGAHPSLGAGDSNSFHRLAFGALNWGGGVAQHALFWVEKYRCNLWQAPGSFVAWRRLWLAYRGNRIRSLRSYSPFLVTTILCIAWSSVGLATLPKPAYVVVQFDAPEPTAGKN
jgi:hypothetical protein